MVVVVGNKFEVGLPAVGVGPLVNTADLLAAGSVLVAEFELAFADEDVMVTVVVSQFVIAT